MWCAQSPTRGSCCPRDGAGGGGRQQCEQRRGGGRSLAHPPRDSATLCRTPSGQGPIPATAVPAPPPHHLKMRSWELPGRGALQKLGGVGGEGHMAHLSTTCSRTSSQWRLSRVRKRLSDTMQSCGGGGERDGRGGGQPRWLPMALGGLSCSAQLEPLGAQEGWRGEGGLNGGPSPHKAGVLPLSHSLPVGGGLDLCPTI